ncbi:MAG: tetratricopeptide repeat protein [Proteobacteria bacterium]|nr:tetratricopeptide repeat protein [Pseudomonadota bacterium]RTL27188.1 MAG: tetratricopeptide repeat protein [Rhodocyclaceae bacterium]
MSKRALAAALLLHILVCSSVKAESVQDLQGLLSQGKFARVAERTDALLASKPQDAQLRFLKGIALAELNRNADAIAVFQKLTEDYPDLPEPYNNLAVLHAKQKQYDKARLALEAAIRLRPGYATAHENLGDVYAGLAGQAYDKAQSLDPSNAAARHKVSIIREITSISPAKAIAPSPLATTPATLPTRPAPPITAPKDTQ